MKKKKKKKNVAFIFSPLTIWVMNCTPLVSPLLPHNRNQSHDLLDYVRPWQLKKRGIQALREQKIHFENILQLFSFKFGAILYSIPSSLRFTCFVSDFHDWIGLMLFRFIIVQVQFRFHLFSFPATVHEC
jgi:hypothetical protein